MAKFGKIVAVCTLVGLGFGIAAAPASAQDKMMMRHRMMRHDHMMMHRDHHMMKHRMMKHRMMHHMMKRNAM